MTHNQAYRTMFREYPDVLDINKMCELLGIGIKTAYKLLRNNRIVHMKIGRSYRIPKINVIDYLLDQNVANNNPSVQADR